MIGGFNGNRQDHSARIIGRDSQTKPAAPIQAGPPASSRPAGGDVLVVVGEEARAPGDAAVAGLVDAGALAVLAHGVVALDAFRRRRLTQEVVRELAGHKRLLLLCGRYEGFDERIRLGLKPREISIGDFICNGGEVAAMVVIDTVARYVPGVLGDPESLAEESHNDPCRLEYPQYTRPRVFRGLEVPEVLLGGNH